MNIPSFLNLDLIVLSYFHGIHFVQTDDLTYWGQNNNHLRCVVETNKRFYHRVQPANVKRCRTVQYGSGTALIGLLWIEYGILGLDNPNEVLLSTI